MAEFQVVFQGEIQAGVDAELARSAVGQLFQLSDGNLERLFSGKRIVIKQGLDAATADKYRQAIERAGAVCVVEPMASETDAAPTAKPASEAPASAESAEESAGTASKGSKLEPRDSFMAAFTEVDAPDYDIAPVGSDLQEQYRDYTPLDIDLAALSLAPVGSDMGEMKKDQTADVPDTSHLKLQDK
ncbi:hypothetical protein [Halopseudomonas salegens]|uniref:Uncharacterized protein n=1 Tax=Halopseudomonas salegens TaxID=1434072 RepID=A0A1H2EM79_9GAMM|nr:hypothetical protein [Halopseudomonas salegens]SDT95868.1 hypothetical protein SAMN05216210_0831 [Halopseudomonas salegens]